MADVSLFGPVNERNVAFLIDTSGSMYFCLRSVQDNLIDALLGLAERDKTGFNVIEFSRRVTAWADRCVSCNSQTVSAAARWIRAREASTGNDLLEAILLAFEDQSCDAVYVVSNSVPVHRKNDIIDNVLFAAKGRPVHCIFLTSTLSDPNAEELLYDLAWETGGSFKVLEVSEGGRFQQATLVFDGEQRQIRSTSGRIYPKEKFCSIVDNLVPPQGAMPPDIGLPWQNRHNPFWWSEEMVPGMPPAAPTPPSYAPSYAERVPLTRYHAARALLREDEVRDAVLGTPALPGPGMLLIDKKVLARRIEDGFYYLGRVKSEVSRDRFLVQFDELSKGKYRNTTFQEVWIYDIISFVDAFRHPIIPGDKVLVPVESGKYAPAVVLQGYEQRSDPTPAHDKNTIVNHLDGRSETLELGMAIWIPDKLFERISFELRLPRAARKTLESHIGYPEAPTLHEKPKEEVVVTDEDEVELEGDVEYEEVLEAESPFDRKTALRNYYENQYEQWPWWWKMWYRKYPVACPQRKPRVIRRTRIVKSPERVRVPRSPSPPSIKPRNFVDYEDSGVASAYFRRIREKERSGDLYPDEVVSQSQYISSKNPNRLSYSDETGTQTTEGDLKRAVEHSRRTRGDQRQPWQYWRAEEQPPQPCDVRASSSPCRRSADYLAEDLRKAEAQRKDAQRWWEAPPVPRQKPPPNEIPNDIEYRNLETYERQRTRSPDIFEPKPEKQFVDYVAQDRETAEWNERTEPKPRPHHHHTRPRTSEECLFQRERKHHHHRYDKYAARDATTYYADYSPPPPPQRYREDPQMPAGMPSLNKNMTVDELRSRRAHHLQRLAAEEELRQRQRKREQQQETRPTENREQVAPPTAPEPTQPPAEASSAPPPPQPPAPTSDK